MTPTRRDFLRYLLATPLALTVDYEQLLWVPSPRIVVPALRGVTLDEINRITLAQLYPGVLETFFAPSPLLEYMRGRQISTVGCAEIQPFGTYNDQTRRAW